MSSSRAEVQAKVHGVYMAQKAITLLEAAGHVCCVTGIKALRYYGSWGVTNDWHFCVPDSDFPAATQLIDSMPGEFEPVEQPMPQRSSLAHTYPRYRSTREDWKTLGFYIMPASEDFLGDLDKNTMERSPNNIPYPKLEVFAQNLMSLQKWDFLTALVDGMDLSLEWGQEHLCLGPLSEDEVEYARAKIQKYRESMAHLGRPDHGFTNGLMIDGVDKSRKWAGIVSRKQKRAARHYNAANWKTEYRRKDSGDPRLQQDRPV